MPRKRTRDGGDAAAAEPIAKRRSARQAAAASTKQTEDKAQVTKEEKRATPAKKPAASGKETKSDKKTESKAATMTEKKKNKDEKARNKPKKNTKAKKEEEDDDDTDRKEINPSNTKGQKEDNNSGSRAVSEDPDVDSIPTINPNAPRHQGEWYWLMKAEPETRLENGIDVSFSIDDLRAKDKPEGWDGSARRPGTPYYDPSSSKDNVRWNLVHVEFRKKFAVPIGLKELRDLGKPGGPLENMQMLKQSRLSVSRVSKEEWEALCELADRKAKDAGLEHETGKLVK
ncbi:hypothetical protein MKX07_005829 [Trichoderma sp. CBMAI-0711]|nr:hypothetical protein MKX07_005829 [Trichoderma sp. CBMAI-0711]